MDEKLPIKFFSKREEDNQRVEGGGSKTFPTSNSNSCL